MGTNFKDNRMTYNLMLETAGYFTRNKKKINKNFRHISLPVLSRFCIDDSNELMSAACNLIISTILNKDEKEEELKYYI